MKPGKGRAHHMAPASAKLADVVNFNLSAEDLRRIEAVATKSGTTVDSWLEGSVRHALASDEAHYREMAEREAAAKAVDREKLRRLLNKNGHGSEPSKETLDLITEQVAVARAEGRAGLELVARACRGVVTAAGVVFDKDGAP